MVLQIDPCFRGSWGLDSAVGKRVRKETKSNALKLLLLWGLEVPTVALHHTPKP